MVFEVKLSDAAKKHRKELDEDIRDIVDEAIDDIKEEGPNHENAGFLSDQRFSDTVLYRYKLVEDKANHRIIFDFVEGKTIRIFDLGHRDWIYDE